MACVEGCSFTYDPSGQEAVELRGVAESVTGGGVDTGCVGEQCQVGPHL